jgi:ribulose-5-phosphate 4-epimerase/fuculose-1-phosphate aldolase
MSDKRAELVQIDDYTTLNHDSTPQHVIVELMKLYYKEGWVSGTGGGVSIKKDGKVYIAPSGVHKERIKPQDIYVLDEEDKIVYDPNEHVTGTTFKISACKPLFSLCFKKRGAGAVMHSHHIRYAIVHVNSLSFTAPC